MKVGLRTPSLSKSVKARTTGKLKRSVKKTVNPFYGQKGMGYIKNPKRAINNKIYHKMTIDSRDIIKPVIEKKNNPIQQPQKKTSNSSDNRMTQITNKFSLIVLCIILAGLRFFIFLLLFTFIFA